MTATATHPNRRLAHLSWALGLMLAVLVSAQPTLHGAETPAIPGITQITSAQQLKQLLKDAKTPVILDFSAVWCVPCKALQKEFPALMQANVGTLQILEVDVDQLPDVATSYNVSAMPTLLLVRDGKTQDTKLGVMTAQQLASWAGVTVPVATAATAEPAATPSKPTDAPSATHPSTPPPTTAPATKPDHSSMREATPPAAAGKDDTTKITLSDDEWKKRLSPELYTVSRRKGTEPAFCGGYTAIEHNGPGLYRCAACGAPLFISETKFDSGSGWPSFFKALPGRVDQSEDSSYGMERTEVHCARCGGHLGHLFNDGPAPTGLRYCINAITLTFEPKVVTPATATTPTGAHDGK